MDPAVGASGGPGKVGPLQCKILKPMVLRENHIGGWKPRFIVAPRIRRVAWEARMEGLQGVERVQAPQVLRELGQIVVDQDPWGGSRS